MEKPIENSIAITIAVKPNGKIYLDNSNGNRGKAIKSITFIAPTIDKKLMENFVNQLDLLKIWFEIIMVGLLNW